MTKSKLAVLIFCAAVGVNILAFVFSKKAWVIEENKNIWLYELPQSASPFDAYVSTDMGPSQGIQATLIRPGSGDHGIELKGMLAQSWNWDRHLGAFTFQMNPNITYLDGSKVLAEHLVHAAEWVKGKLIPYQNELSPVWKAWLDSDYRAINNTTLQVTFKTSSLNSNVTSEKLLTEVFTQAFTGTIHPKNLEDLKQGKKLTQEWITSGPYLIRKWNPKEVILVSRMDYPPGLGLEKGFYRVVKYQSAPVINPAAHFLQAMRSEKEVSDEHFTQERDSVLHVFWICRSWKDPSSFCADPVAREAFAKALAQPSASVSLAGKTVRYRIPIGSEPFREEIRNQIRDRVTQVGGVAKEISFFFKNSNEADIELQFVTTSKNAESKMAERMSRLSTRMGGAAVDPSLVGEIGVFPLNIQWKGSPAKGEYEAYQKVFIEPDFGDKRLLLKEDQD